ncbi:hypothetical protein [Flintibacter muris]|nr:hypothetical protein [Flintibacter muris]
MNNEIYYVLVDDHIVTRQEVEMAFYVTHGLQVELLGGTMEVRMILMV